MRSTFVGVGTSLAIAVMAVIPSLGAPDTLQMTPAMFLPELSIESSASDSMEPVRLGYPGNGPDQPPLAVPPASPTGTPPAPSPTPGGSPKTTPTEPPTSFLAPQPISAPIAPPAATSTPALDAPPPAVNTPAAATPTATPTAAPIVATATPTATLVAVPSATPTTVPIAVPTATSTPAPSPIATSTPAPTATPTAAPAPSATPTPTAPPTATPTSVPTATPVPTATATPTATAAPPAVFVGAGDIAQCGSPGAAATAALLDGIPGTVFTLGDNAYASGTATEFNNCYEPTWGRHKARTRPAVGNHEYYTSGASGYYGYFGATAGEPGKGYYSYNLGAWHIVVLNTNCDAVGGCTSTSPQAQWLRADLAANPAMCTAAIGHAPRFSSGRHGSAASVQPFWQILYDAGVEIALAGHDHSYERFAPQDPTGKADPVRGIRQFVVGSGGASHYALGTRIANSEVGNSDAFGVLKLTLRGAGYEWQFVPEAGKTFTDSGTGTCR